LNRGRRLGRGILLASLCGSAPMLAAFAQGSTSISADSNSARIAESGRGHLLSRREIAFGSAAILATGMLAPLDRPIQRSLQSEDLQDNRGLRRVGRAFALAGGPGPFVAGGALYLAGRGTSSPRLAALGVHLTEGVVVAAALTGLIKGVSGRELPNATSAKPGDFSFGRGFHEGNGSFVSFPSGHTAASFAAAAVLTDDVSRWDSSAARIVSPVAYSAATLVALSRLYQNLHWASDLPIGAAIGVLSGKSVVSWQRRHPENWLDRHLVGVTIAPDGHRVLVAGSVPVGR
jgi:membrane-associated phospholipid phosphatase